MELRQTAVPREEVFLSRAPDAVADRVAAALSPAPVDEYRSPRDSARLQRELLQKEIELLRARIDIIRTQAGIVVASGAACVEVNARAQLGAHPFTKFGMLVGASYFLTSVLKKLPFGSIAATAMPLAMLAIEYRRNGHGQ